MLDHVSSCLSKSCCPTEAPASCQGERPQSVSSQSILGECEPLLAPYIKAVNLSRAAVQQSMQHGIVCISSCPAYF